MSWNAIIDGVSNGVNGTIYCMAKDSLGNIYVGGSFSTAGPISANNIARWDGSHWHALDNGVNNQVNAIAIDSHNNVYIGGTFDVLNGTISTRSFAMWNGTWNSLGVFTGYQDGSYTSSNYNAIVYAIAIDKNDNVYVGGLFTGVDAITTYNFIKWDYTGQNWVSNNLFPFSNGYDFVNSMTSDSNNNVYIARYGVASYIYNGINLTIINNYSVFSISCIACDSSDNIYASSPNNPFYKYNGGTSWTSIGLPKYNSLIYSIAFDSNNNIYVGGYWDLPVKALCAKYDISTLTWSQIGDYNNDNASKTIYSILLDASDNVYIGGNITNIAGVSVNNIAEYVLYNPPLPVPCFKEGSKILVFENGEEKYIPIETLRKGMLVKTLLNGYKPVNIIGTSTIFNPCNEKRIKHRLYACKKEHFPELTEDELVLTGCHSILVDDPSELQIEKTKEMFGKIYVTDAKFRLIACFDDRAEPYKCEGTFNIYHLALDNDNYYGNYGIYANNLLVESCSIRYLSELSNMKLIE